MAKILIAEDDMDIRELVVLTLQFSGHDVVSVEDGAAAVEASQGDSFDLILMDVRMPRMSGYEACRIIKDRKETQDVPVIFLSAKGQESEIQSGLLAGAEQYVLKPFAPEELVETIQKVLNRS